MKIAISVAVILLVILGISLLSSENSEKKDDNAMMENQEMMEGDSMMKGDEDKMMEGDSMMKEDENKMMESSGTYENYSSSKLSKANSGDVVLFFKADWCPTCVALDKNIKANLNSIPDGVSILEVDYDNSAELKQKYGVTYQHTFVQVDAEGNQIAKWSGSPTLSSLLNEIK